jgi:hypothetical protein
VKTYAGWLSRTTNLSKRQIFDDVSILVSAHCTDGEKVQRWYDGERAELEAWFQANVDWQLPEPERPALMSAEDCQLDDDLSLEIPEAVKNPGGLISLGMEALSQPGMVKIEQYSLPAILTVLANAIAGKLAFRGVHPNLFNVRVGKTSTGKTQGDKELKNGINSNNIIGFYGPSDFASGPALLRSMVDRPSCLVVIDEGTSLFRRSGKADMVADGKRDALLELFSASGQRLEKAYADRRSNIIIESPCLSLTANATPTIFDSIENQDFATGLMQRFDFWAYDGPAPKRDRPVDDGNPALGEFVDAIKEIYEAYPGSLNVSNYTKPEHPNSAFSLGITEDASDVLYEWSNTVVDRQNAVEDDGVAGIIARSYDLAIKYAMVHLAATRPTTELFEPLSVADIEYGIKTAWMLADWKISRLRSRVTCGDFDRDCELFKEAIRIAVGKGRRPTHSVLVDRRRQLKNFPPNYIEQIVKALTARCEVFVDTTKREPAYNLVRWDAGQK